MDKGTANISKHITIHLKEDAIDDSELKTRLKSLDARVQQMLLWSITCSVWSYLILLIVVVRVYSSFNGVHSVTLITSMVLMYLLMGALVYLVWKGMDYKRSYYYFTGKNYLKYQVNKLLAQRKLLTLYLLTYTLLLLVTGIFFFIDIPHGIIFLLKITTPASIITYASGLYFIANFNKQIKQLELIHKQINYLHIQHLNPN